MEGQTHLFQNYSKHIETIKAIQKNLNILKSKIHNLTKEEVRTQSKIVQAISDSIPIIKNKMSSPNFNSTKSQWTMPTRQEQGTSMSKKRATFRTKQKASKSEHVALQENKENNYEIIKQMSRDNDQRIMKAKQKIILDHRKKSELVKVSQVEGKKRIEEFHLIKKYQIRKQRRNEQIILKNKICDISKLLNKTEQYKQELSRKVQDNKQTVKIIKLTTNKLDNMNEKQLQSIKNDLQIKEVKKVDDNLIESVLIEVDHRTNDEQEIK